MRSEEGPQTGSLLCSTGPGADGSQGPSEPGSLLGKQGCSPGLHSFNLAEVCRLPQVTILRIGHISDRPADASVNAHHLQRAGVVDFLMTQKSTAAHLASCLFVLFWVFFFGVRLQGPQRQGNQMRNRYQFPLNSI